MEWYNLQYIKKEIIHPCEISFKQSMALRSYFNYILEESLVSDKYVENLKRDYH
ncbi:MAG: hypothetical protein AMDU5_GPLC00007G0088 [Thermoplasmatales archaeon Gpl]|nr:MAG: hypothetical protein AMDU5_GPLC00007G0088 [Thermoplasmatales archaeon Gpl]